MRYRSKQEDRDLIIGGILLWLVMGGGAKFLWLLISGELRVVFGW